MTFYDVDISSPKLVGLMTGFEDMLWTLVCLDVGLAKGTARHAPYCEKCKIDGLPDIALTNHVYLVRHNLLLSMVRGQNVLWSKKRGMGRAKPEDFLQNPTQEFKDIEFQVRLWEV